ncbi:MAG: flagellar hook-length control protein FliK [Steroidobacteraceae bacterium]
MSVAGSSLSGGARAGQPSKQVSKGVLPTRGTTAKALAPAQAQASSGVGAKPAGAAGLNFLETLAQSLNASEPATPLVVAGAAPAAAADNAKAADEDTKTSDTDSNAIALALASQSLAALLGLPAVMPPMAATPAPAQTTSGDGATDGATSAVSLTSGSSIQDLVSLLVRDGGADSKGKSSTDTPQIDVAAAPATPTDLSAAAGPSVSLDPLGMASHFVVQHPHPDSNRGGELRAPVGTAAWNDELGGQMTWMAHQGLESASLRLSPEHLGPLEIHISVRDGDASVWFGATQPDTRAALEQALPRLREMFATQGLTLADSGVSREPPRNHSRPSPAAHGIAPVAALGGADLPATSAALLSLGLLDTYA